MGRKATSERPPLQIYPSEVIAKVLKPRGNSQYHVEIPSTTVPKIRQLLSIPANVPLPPSSAITLATPTPSTQAESVSKTEPNQEEEEHDQQPQSDSNNGQQIEPPISLIAEMPPVFRNNLFVKRGGYVIISIKPDVSLCYKDQVDTEASPESKLDSDSDSQTQQDDSNQDDSADKKKKAKSGKNKQKGKNPLKQKLLLAKQQQQKDSSSSSSLLSGQSKKTLENAVVADIVNIVMAPRLWQKMDYWPQEYVSMSKGWDRDDALSSDDDEEDENPPRDLPPSDDEDVEYY